MTAFSSSTADAALITIILLVHIASFIVCALGLLCYRSLMSGRRQFFSSLRNELSDAAARTHAHSLVRTYVVLTLLLTVATSTFFFWFYRFP